MAKHLWVHGPVNSVEQEVEDELHEGDQLSPSFLIRMSFTGEVARTTRLYQEGRQAQTKNPDLSGAGFVQNLARRVQATPGRRTASIS